MKTAFRARTRYCFKQSLSLCLAVTAMIAATEFPVQSAQAQTDTPSQLPSIRDIPDADALPPAPGLIFDMAGQRYVMFDDMVSRLAGTRFVLIGEKHDNPIHHHHQAQLVRALSKRENTRRAVVWEMFNQDQQENLDQAWQAVSPEELGSEMNWGESGWPSWHDYAPIAEAAKENGLPMVAGNLPQNILRPMIREGISAMPTELAEKLALPPIPDDIAARFDQEIAEGHCNMLPKSQLPAFSLVQFARDASLARTMIDVNKTNSPDGAFLIAGAMHVRNDVAVPYHLHRYAPDLTDKDIAVVILVEADDPGEDLPGVRDYALRMGSEDVADFMWFTNDLPRTDPCEDMNIGQ
ncbi:ChaN family lipoprotein [Thalassospiraceae bacterium SW-3-3]|nr:ChaN family lipoprotein [Thalassospiraceae bacterium SW-3-3]